MPAQSWLKEPAVTKVSTRSGLGCATDSGEAVVVGEMEQ